MIKIQLPKFNPETAIKYLREQTIFQKINKIQNNHRMEPNYVDLARIHKIIRKYKIFTSLEFGIGYSTYVISDALNKNKIDYTKSKFKKIIKKNNLFENHCIDSSKKWISFFKKDFKNFSYKNNTIINYSAVYLDNFNNKICTYYEKIPSILPDFIYLDGPDPDTVKNKLENIDYKNNDFVVMSADILKFENYLLPGCIIIIDGRNTNSRFLKDNLSRNWVYYESYKEAISLLYLNEKPIGLRNYNYLQYKFSLKNK